ncbi:MAG: 50S ribosomal protein L23 [Candidatus Marinimicrobia bacterium]|nr:50S ribosomal protein L23 [Candidatus Neomarinimicrobiota bacterium]|tara:strand:- start:810 stop:1124 length:315 start_codon:yes stop_codon:yes gene_type:complete
MKKNNIILSPILSEKSHGLSEQFNKYVFKVDKGANKLEIKKSIENRFNVKIVKVSTMNFKGKQKNMTIRSDGNVLRTTGNRSNWKKAIVTLDKDSKINFVEGEF